MSVIPELEIQLDTERATLSFAQALAPFLRGGDLVVLTGDLGAGKTFFSGGLCRALGLDADERVTSPTYNLVQEYQTEPPIYHCDLYRLSHEDELEELGLDEARQAGALLLVEWGAPYIRGLGGDAIELNFCVEPRAVSVPSSAQLSSRQAEILQSLRASLGLQTQNTVGR